MKKVVVKAKASKKGDPTSGELIIGDKVIKAVVFTKEQADKLKKILDELD